jgi:thiosulfate dehydrogenase
VRIIDDPLERGNAVNGALLYDRACGYCHGEISTGTGRLGERVPRLPEDGIAEHEGYTPRLLRLVFIEKVRHGKFFGYGGDMPPFSREVLSDAELSDILEALGLTGE